MRKAFSFSQLPGRGGAAQHGGVAPHVEAPGTVRRWQERGENVGRPLLWFLGKEQRRQDKQAQDWLVCVISGGLGHTGHPLLSGAVYKAPSVHSDTREGGSGGGGGTRWGARKLKKSPHLSGGKSLLFCTKSRWPTCVAPQSWRREPQLGTKSQALTTAASRFPADAEPASA